MTTFAYIYTDPLIDTAAQAEFDGWDIERTYHDLGQRQQLQQLISDCQQQSPKYLIVRHLQELGDTVTEIGDRLNQLEALEIEVIALKQNYQTSQATKSNLALLLSEIQTNQYSRRLQQGHARNRLKTLPPPGKAPYGYRRGKERYIIDKSTAPVVKDFFEQFLLFGSLRGAVKYLEKRYGKKIAPSTGHKWLTNPVYRGNLQYKDGATITQTHAAIIEPEAAAQIDRLLKRNSLLPPRTASAPRSLAGLVICDACQLPMTVSRVTQRNKKLEYLYLRCPQCPQSPKCKAINYQAILDTTIHQICQELPLAVQKLPQHQPNKLQDKIDLALAAKKAILNQIEDLSDRGILDRETAELRSYKIQQEIAQLAAKIAQLPPKNLQAIADTVSLPQFWFDLSEAERRFYFREFINQILLVRLAANQWDLKLVFIF
ncbi:MAG TPA: recombinase family protein [Xenococcaceae cyanobacterium]